MKIYKEEKVEVTKEVLSRVICDVCGKEIKKENRAYEVTTGHNDWGNDSYESVKHKDICSDECLKVELEKYLNSTYKSKFIEIQK